METPHEARLEEHQAVLDSMTFLTQELSSKDEGISAKPCYRGDDLFPTDHKPPLEPEGDICNQKKRFTCVSFNTVELRQAVCFQEPIQDFLNAAPGTSQLLLDNYSSTSQASDEDCCCGLPPPAHRAEAHLNQIPQRQPDHSLNLYSRCVRRDFKAVEPISNGSIINQACASILEIPADLFPKTSDLPHSVKQTPSTITFTASSCSCINHASGYNSSDGEESSDEEKEKVKCNHVDSGEGDDDDVFLEWPHSKDHPMTKKKRGCVRPQAETLCPPSTCGYEAEEELSSKEVCFYRLHKFL